jgi:hypothetical protein
MYQESSWLRSCPNECERDVSLGNVAGMAQNTHIKFGFPHKVQ